MVVIKSMARKQPSFGQLLSYFDKEQHHGDTRITHNCLASPSDRDGLAAELEHNATFLPKRQNGNYLYHEILSLPPGLDASDAYQARALIALAREYIRLRAPNQLVVGKLHRETDHQHIHLAISANEVRGKQRCWMRKTDLARIQMEVERYANIHWPELGLHRHYEQAYQQTLDRTSPKISSREGELKRRTGKASDKERAYQEITSIFEKVKSEDELHQQLSQLGYELYVRSQNTEGVRHVESGRKYRLQTIGLRPALQKARSRIAVFEERQEALSRDQNRQHNRERGRDA